MKDQEELLKRIGEMDGENQELLVEVSRLKEVIVSDMVYVIIWVVDDIWWKIDGGFGSPSWTASSRITTFKMVTVE